MSSFRDKPAIALEGPSLHDFKAGRIAIPVRLLVGLVLVAAIGIAWTFRGHPVLRNPAAVLDEMRGRPMQAGSVFVLIYAVTAAAGIPTLPLNVAGGWLWGSLLGGALSAAGATAGATAAFLAARTIFGQPLRRRMKNDFIAWAQQEFDKKGWRFVVFVRLNPVFPTGPLNYLFGLTSIGTRTYVWATVLSLLPASTMVAWIGSELGGVGAAGSATQLMRSAAGVSAAVSLLVGLRYGARYLNQRKARTSL